MHYADFLAAKAVIDPATGLADIPELPPALFDFQRDIVTWALRRGRAAIFAGTGLGKSLMELSWADAVHRATGRDVLVLTPLAVAAQEIREAAKFGLTAQLVKTQADVQPGVSVTNYEKIAHFDLHHFGGVVLDESSILKAFDGKRRSHLIASFQDTPFRLAATATPAPNDFMELGNHAEFLGVMSYVEMLSMFFVHDGGDTSQWRLKGHAESDFWRWMCSWSVMLRKPSDLGYEDGGFDLPPLYQHQHTVEVEYKPTGDWLFPMQAQTMQERIRARKDTVAERVEAARQLIVGQLFGDEKCCSSQKWKKFQNKNASDNTCENITETTNIDGRNGRQKSKQNTTKKETESTTQTKNTETKYDLNSELDARSPEKASELKTSSVSTSSNTTAYSNSKTEDALFAEQKRLTPAEDNLQSIIATRLERSEDYFVAIATSELVNSATTLICSQERSNISAKDALTPWVIWCGLNNEQDALKEAFGDLAISITGSDSEEKKESLHQDWLNGKAPVLITKSSIFGYGLNWQHCADMAFVGLNDSWEQVYQSIRRCWRFGQTKPVNVHFIASEIEGAVVANLARKDQQASEMAQAMVDHMHGLNEASLRGTTRQKVVYMRDQKQGDGWTVNLGDCVEVVGELATDSLHYSMYSPPFASLYTYSASDRDMGNCKDADEFMAHYRYLVREIYRATMPGRLTSFHCMNLPTSKVRDGVIGLSDFRGDLIRVHQEAGWIFHSEVCIWKDPVTAMQRTKALGLLHKQIKKDSCMSRQGIPDYVVTMRKPGDNPERVTHTDEDLPVQVWQRYASPVWMDINPSDTLQYRSAREHEDERHIAPLQLEVIRRCMHLWSNEGDLVLSPFTGIGSEGYIALQMGRRFVGAELKRSYWEQACRNLEGVRRTQESLLV